MAGTEGKTWSRLGRGRNLCALPLWTGEYKESVTPVSGPLRARECACSGSIGAPRDASCDGQPVGPLASDFAGILYSERVLRRRLRE
eukprot:scaffold74158_cov59-Phaeocystis_antarctica.AAC.2